jgi:hypothetical protein
VCQLGIVCLREQSLGGIWSLRTQCHDQRISSIGTAAASSAGSVPARAAIAGISAEVLVAGCYAGPSTRYHAFSGNHGGNNDSFIFEVQYRQQK